MEPTRLDSTGLDAPVRLSLTQRCDLLSQAVAAVITSGLIAVAFVGSSFTAEPPIAARPLPQLTMVVGGLEGRTVHTPHALRLAPRARLARAADVSKGAPPKRERRTFGRRVASILTGSGAYSVRPFPTVPDTRQ